MEYAWLSIPSGNASRGYNSLAPPCGTQATSHVVALVRPLREQGNSASGVET